MDRPCFVHGLYSPLVFQDSTVSRKSIHFVLFYGVVYFILPLECLSFPIHCQSHSDNSLTNRFILHVLTGKIMLSEAGIGGGQSCGINLFKILNSDWFNNKFNISIVDHIVTCGRSIVDDFVKFNRRRWHR